MSSSLRGKTILITGGTSGIGRTTALHLAKAGAQIVFTGRRAAEGQAVLKELTSLGGRAEFVQGDVTSEAHVQDAVAAAVRLGGRLDGAFNNAGVEFGGRAIAETSADDYRRVFDVNVLGVLLCMKHQFRAMAGGKGSIVNTASIAASVGMPGAGVYIASKHAVLGLSRTAALEGAKAGVRVNTVSPAAIKTDMFDRFTGGGDKATVEFLTSLHPVGRVGTTDEVAAAVLFLLSEEASFITGHDLMVDGGFTVP